MLKIDNTFELMECTLTTSVGFSASRSEENIFKLFLITTRTSFFSSNDRPPRRYATSSTSALLDSTEVDSRGRLWPCPFLKGTSLAFKFCKRYNTTICFKRFSTNLKRKLIQSKRPITQIGMHKKKSNNKSVP